MKQIYFVERMTIYSVDKNGEYHDLNIDGDRCKSKEDLIEFIEQLHYADCFDVEMRDELLDEVEAEYS